MTQPEPNTDLLPGGENAPGWRPNPGDKVVGKVLAVDAIRSSYGAQDYYPIITVADEDTEEAVAVHGFHYVLKDRLLALQPKVGERIGIQYIGEKPTKDGKRTVNVYTVRVQGRDVDVWSRMGAPAPAPTSDVPDEGFEVAAQSALDDDIPF